MNPMERALQNADAIIAQDKALDAVLNDTPPVSYAVPQWSELTPRYGRDYTKKADVVADFLAGKDFTFAATGQACSIRDVQPGTSVLLRYKRHTMVTTLKVTAAHHAALKES